MVAGPSRFRKNAVSGGVIAACNILLVFLSYPIYLRYLGVEWYGLWAALSVVITVSQIGDPGIHLAVIRHVAHALGRGEPEEASRFIGASLVLVMVPCAFVIAACNLFSGEILAVLRLNQPFSDTGQRVLPMIGCLSALVLVAEVLKGIVIGMDRMDIANYLFLGARCVQFGISVFFVATGTGVLGLLYGTALGYLLLISLYLVVVFRRSNISIITTFSFSMKQVRKLVGFGSYITASSLVSMLMDPFNKIVLSRYLGLESVVAYEIGLKGVQAVRAVYEGAVKAIMPEISRISGLSFQANSATKLVYRKVVQAIAGTAIPIFILMFVASKPLLQLWLGAEFTQDMTNVLRWFCIGYSINTVSVPSFYALLGLNRSKECFYAALLRSSAHFLAVIVTLIIGLTLSLNLLVGIHTVSMIGSALLTMFMFHRVITSKVAFAD